jgi:DNA-binding CsgD family transcriptional regulator
VILSRYPNESYVTEALRRGALGYVVKQTDVADLLRAVRTVARGPRNLGAPLSEDSIEVWMARANRKDADPYDTLTGREREILQLVAEGYSSSAMARRLANPRTAEAHRANVMRKLRLHKQAALIRYALSRGVLAPALGAAAAARFATPTPARTPGAAAPAAGPDAINTPVEVPLDTAWARTTTFPAVPATEARQGGTVPVELSCRVC